MKKIISVSLIVFSLVFISCKKGSPKEIWVTKTAGEVATLHFIKDSTIIASTGKYMEHGSPYQFLIAINSNDGKIVWQKDMGSNFMINYVSSKDDKIYISSYNTQNSVKSIPLWIDFKTGNTLENITAEKPSKIIHENFYKGNPVIASQGDSKYEVPQKIVCRDMKTKELIWSYDIKKVENVKDPDAINFSFLLNGNFLYIGKYDGNVIAVKID